ncbi:MAG: hypothetical protein SFU56_16400 [Capsulimonadales bacterium]|nr:hypothetical protein [Capsulimonadales bacterium]
MARLNLTIPDALYERLERLRDRVNVSKICAAALTKELDMLEGSTVIAGDAKVQRLVQRFLRERESRERWYQRGRHDGEEWAIERASLEELERVHDDWDEDEIREADELDDFDIDDDDFPTVDLKETLNRWIREERQAAGGSVDVEWKEYVRGWYHGARDLWRAARQTLR